MKVAIVVPTYNEADNIEKLFTVLDGVFKDIPNHEMHVLVVDGNSPDGTADLVKANQEKYPWAHVLLEEKKAGLGAAYIFGFRHAVEKLGAEVLIEMDADFQHDPNDIKKFLAEIDNGYDYIIGSRFIAGGSIPKDWGLMRKFFSIGGSVFSKLVLGIFNVNDFTSGYKATRVKGFFDKLDLDHLMSRGFAYKIDLLYRMHKLKAKIKEVPIKFGLRDRGDSKMEQNNFSDSLRVVLTLRFGDYSNFVKFCVVGFAGLAVDASLFNILRISVLKSNVAALVSGLIAMIVTYLLNNFWSFRERKIESLSTIVLTFFPYALISFVPIVFRSQLILFATRISDTFLMSNAAFFVGIVLGLIWNFVVYSKVVWRKKHA